MGKIAANTLDDACLNCVLCGLKNKKAGPIWSGALHKREFVTKVRNNLEKNFKYFPTFNRLSCKLKIIERECRLNDSPYFISQNKLSRRFSCDQMKNSILRSVLE